MDIEVTRGGRCEQASPEPPISMSSVLPGFSAASGGTQRLQGCALVKPVPRRARWFHEGKRRRLKAPGSKLVRAQGFTVLSCSVRTSGASPGLAFGTLPDAVMYLRAAAREPSPRGGQVLPQERGHGGCRGPVRSDELWKPSQVKFSAFAS
jgi:hypothetical protein